MKELFNQFREQLGWQGISGIVLLAMVVAFQMLVLKSLEQEVAYMRSHSATAQAKSPIQGRNYRLGNQTKELDMFFDSLPAEQDVTDVLGLIYSAAEASGVGLRQAEYHPEGNNKSRVEYGMVFPVQGEYAKIRYFIARVLADHPAIALDQINFQRDKISDPVLKAEIRMTLFLKQSSNVQ